MLWCLCRYIIIQKSCKRYQFCQAIPSTFCLHMQFPLLGSHFGVLLKLPSGRQLQSVHPEGPKSQEVSSQASHCCPVTPGLHSHCPSSAHCCLTDPINGILRFFHNSILTTLYYRSCLLHRSEVKISTCTITHAIYAWHSALVIFFFGLVMIFLAIFAMLSWSVSITI